MPDKKPKPKTVRRTRWRANKRRRCSAPQQPEYTLNQPPTCPTNRDHLRNLSKRYSMNTPLTQRNSSHHVHTKTVGRVRVRSLAARGLAVVLIALAASLALPLQAQQEHADPTPTVIISADKMRAVFKEDDITYTLTRSGLDDAALPVTVRLMQTEDFLAATELTNKTVTINAGRSTATFTVAASSFQHFAAGTKVEGGTLEAVVQDGDNYDLGMTSSVEVEIAIGVMIGFEMAAYSVGEATGPVKVKVIAHTGPGAGQPTSEATYNIRFCCKVWDHARESVGWTSLRGQSEHLVDQLRLPDHVALRHPSRLSLAERMHDLDAAQGPPRRGESLEAQHRPGAAFDESVVLLDDVVQILALAKIRTRSDESLVSDGLARDRAGGVLVHGHHARGRRMSRA